MHSRGQRFHHAVLPPAFALVLLALMLSAVSGCGNKAASKAGNDTDEPRSVEIIVSAAASLTESFTALAEELEATHTDVTVVLNFASSQTCATQIEEGVPADVFASADTAQMDRVGDLTREPAVFAGNELAIAVQPGNPEGISGLQDLARDDLTVVLAAEGVPVGEYARQTLAAQGVDVEPASLEDNVKAVLTKVELGEADAGVVYGTDIAVAGDKVEGIPIPEDQNVPATYPIAVLKDAAHPEQAQAFADYVLSPKGQTTLARYGFLPGNETGS